MRVLWRRFLRILQMLFFVVAVLSFYIVNKHYFVLTYLLDFPKATELSPEIPRYDLQKFGVPIRAGFSKKDITPKRFSWVAGYMPPHPALSIKDRLWVKSLAMQDKNGNQVVIVSCDIIGLLPDEIDNIFSQVKAVSKDKIFLSATHTHSGPDTIGLWGGKNKLYMETLRVKIAEAIDESIKEMRKASFRFGQGEFSGRANGRDENPADPMVSVLQVLISQKSDVKKESLITLVNFACHPDVVQGLQISADYPYFLSERLRMRLGSETMFIPAAIGGVQPEGDRKELLSYRVRTLGEDLADAVVAIMRRPKKIQNADISVLKIKISAPFENTKDLAKAVKFGLVTNLSNERNEVVAEVGKITIGPLKFFTVPGELFPKIWLRVKMHDENCMIFGLTNGEFGYIMLPEDFYSGKHNYHAGVSVGPIFGQRIYEAMKKLAVEK